MNNEDAIMTSIQYIKDNYITIDSLSKRSLLSNELIESYIEAGCLPQPSYNITNNTLINSVLGQYNEKPEIVAYFPVSHLPKIETILSLAEDMPLDRVKLALYDRFLGIYTATLHENDVHLWGLESYITADGELLADGKMFLESEWQHYLNGTYGLCTKTATTKDIAVKEVSIAKIKYLISKNSHRNLTVEETEELRLTVDELDRVSARFAPHELENSSRHTYINEVRKKNF